MKRATQILVDTDQLDLPSPNVVEPQRVAASPAGMVATAHFAATAAGREILELGGNAVDAAVAAALALGVCEPAASGLGGQTMMLIHTAEPRRTFALDGSSRAPNRAAAEIFAEGSRRFRGHASTTVPSTLAALDYARREYGTLELSQLLAPAIHLAEEGYPVTSLQNRLTRRELKKLKGSSAAPFFLKDGARPHAIGTIFRQPVLAQTLRRIGEGGIEEFYRGQIAQQIDADMQAHAGLVRLDDLAQVPHPIERRPVSCHFGPLRVITFPPPGAGRTLVEMLNILEQFPAERRDPDTPEGAAMLAETIRTAFMDRRDRPYDPSFYAQVDDKRMMSADYAAQVARNIRKRLRAKRPLAAATATGDGQPAFARPVRAHGETTHLSVMDRHGNAVALTQSIERVYGSCAACPELGFLYNDYMSAFDYSDMGHPYYMRPNAVPWASVAPTIVFRGRRPWLAIGSPGSERITPSILQVLLRLERQSPYDAVAAARLFCSLKGKVSLEAGRMRDDIPLRLEQLGYSIDRREPYSFYLGCVQLVAHEKKTYIGVADPRRDGSAAGPVS